MSDATTEKLADLMARYEQAVTTRDEAIRALQKAHADADAADEELVACESSLASWLDEAKALVRIRVRRLYAEKNLGAQGGEL